MRGVHGSASYEHGTEDCYVNGKCRRPECRQAATRARKIRRLVTKDQVIPLRVPSAGSVRRLQALMTQGWSLPLLEQRAGVRDWYYRQTMHQKTAVVDRARAERISSLYDELWDQEPPQTTRGERFSAACSKTTARRNGWAPPMAWEGIDIDDPYAEPRLHADAEEEIFDWVKVDRVVAGHAEPKTLTHNERIAAAQRLVKRGVARRTAAQRLGLHYDVVREDAAA